jgi:hypothetical protein
LGTTGAPPVVAVALDRNIPLFNRYLKNLILCPLR